ncbi:hypothetical protein J437_LFUL019249 [Ladona fulva]|uniref:Uncharacterized protein n=1 Tax=Ladona fulva TaxID=123851 RepID=A0A8K0KRZ7_LADFU|nr:hypothetical protein J437_LFUL019249 [Ladona fulva]
MSILQGGNCVPQDGTTLLSVAGNSTVNPHIPKTRLPEPLRDEVDQGPPEDHTYSLISKSTTVSAYVDDVGAANILIKMRTNGGLHVPSKDLTTVCQLAENVFRRFQANGQLTARAAMDRMQSHCLREISERKSGVFCSLNDHALDQTPFDKLMTFALTFNFYSPKAYNYVRDKFNASLPHPSTLRRRFSTVKVSAGFTYEILPTLQRIAREKHPATVLGALSMDEIAIRRHVEWDGKGLSGYIDYGTGLDSDDLPFAKEALTFMLIVVNGQWKLPVGYFFIKGLDATERANLVQQALDFLKESGKYRSDRGERGHVCQVPVSSIIQQRFREGNIAAEVKPGHHGDVMLCIGIARKDMLEEEK